MAHVTTKKLQCESTWHKILAGDRMLPISLLARALDEISIIYQLAERADGFHASVTSLLRLAS